LTIRINTLICFHAILKFLDQFTMVEKLIPALKVIKTAEPAILVSNKFFRQRWGEILMVTSIR